MRGDPHEIKIFLWKRKNKDLVDKLVQILQIKQCCHLKSVTISTPSVDEVQEKQEFQNILDGMC